MLGFGTIAKKVFGTPNDRKIKATRPTVAKITALEPEFRNLTDDDLKARTATLKERVAKGDTLDSVLPEAFATCREAARRALGLRAFDVQLIGGIFLHRGNIAEMKTGEGKTLVATFPAYLNALTGKGVHIVTVNDYLACRDAEWMGKVYGALGLTTGVVVPQQPEDEKKAAYAADITYATNNELRLRLPARQHEVRTGPELMQRGHNFAIVDEVDSILIDEARTPLIISGPARTAPSFTRRSTVIPELLTEEHVHARREDSATSPSPTRATSSSNSRLQRPVAARGAVALRPGIHDARAPRHAGACARTSCSSATRTTSCATARSC